MEHLEETRARLVDRDDDDLVVGHAPDDVEHVLGILGGQAGGRFVEKVDIGDADDIHADVEALALAVRHGLAARVAGQAVAPFLQPEFGELGLDPAETLGAGEMGGADGGGGGDVLLDGEQRVEALLVGHEGDVGAQGRATFAQGDAVEGHGPLGGAELARQDAQQGGFAAPARAHDADHLAAPRLERNRFQRRLVAHEGMGQVAYLEPRDQAAFLLDDAVAEMAAQELPFA